jgi:hypothetical protein
MPQYKYLYKYKYGSHLSSTPTLHLAKQVPSVYDIAKAIFCNFGKFPMEVNIYGNLFKVKGPPRSNSENLSGVMYSIPGPSCELGYPYYITKDEDVITGVNYKDPKTDNRLYPSTRFPDYKKYLDHLKKIDDRYNNGETITVLDAMITVFIWVGEFYRGKFVCY